MWSVAKPGEEFGTWFAGDSLAVTDAELEAMRIALLAEEQELTAETERLRSRPHDRAAHRAHRANLKAHLDRIQDYRAAVELRRST